VKVTLDGMNRGCADWIILIVVVVALAVVAVVITIFEYISPLPS
jgi:flagellar basal body-associated protein FliL